MCNKCAILTNRHSSISTVHTQIEKLVFEDLLTLTCFLSRIYKTKPLIREHSQNDLMKLTSNFYFLHNSFSFSGLIDLSCTSSLDERSDTYKVMKQSSNFDVRSFAKSRLLSQPFRHSLRSSTA